MRLIICFAILYFASCKHNHKTSASSDQPLYQEVMAIHDKVMPEMSTIHQLKKDLKALEKPETREIILNHVKELDDADEAMMSWMADFKIPEDKNKEEGYLLSEKEKIKQVSDVMYGSMERAKQLIDSLQIQNK